MKSYPGDSPFSWWMLAAGSQKQRPRPRIQGLTCRANSRAGILHGISHALNKIFAGDRCPTVRATSDGASTAFLAKRPAQFRMVIKSWVNDVSVQANLRAIVTTLSQENPPCPRFSWLPFYVSAIEKHAASCRGISIPNVDYVTAIYIFGRNG